VPDPKQPTTAPPPFDPEEFARSSETGLDAAPDRRMTTAQFAPPPLNRRVRLAVPEADLAWFELTDEARSLVGRLDGTRTLLELMEVISSPSFLHAVAELHDAKLLVYEEK